MLLRYERLFDILDCMGKDSDIFLLCTKHWKQALGINRKYLFWLIVFFIFSFILGQTSNINAMLVSVLIFFLFLFLSGLHLVYYQTVKLSLSPYKYSPVAIRKKIILGVLFVLSLYALKDTPWILENIDSASLVFLAIFPMLYLLKLTNKFAGLLALTFLLLTSIMLSMGFEKTAENMAILAYFFLWTIVVSSIVDLKRNKGNEEN